MKNRLTLLILMIITQTALKAQDFSKEYGKIGKEETELTSYLPDKSAEAVVLFDIGKSYFSEKDGSLDIIFERSARIKIFSDPGLKWAEVEIPFYHEGGIFESVYEIEGCTYNPENGYMTRTVFDAVNCHDEKLNDFWTLKKFALPNVKAGSIIEYRYKINSQYKFNLRDWNFQNQIPTIYSEYEVSMVPFYDYAFLLQGRNKFDVQTSNEQTGIESRFAGIEYHDMVHKFIMKNVPAFKDEEFITSVDDYIIKIDFQLSKINHPGGSTTLILTTWPEVVKELIKHEDVTKFAKKCEKLSAKLFSPDSLLQKSQKEKFDFILSYVKANFNWNKSNGKYASKSPNELLKDKIGNAADLNLLTIGLLNAAGIESYPVIMSTRDNGKIKIDYPYLSFFNYLLISANVDGKDVLSDATGILCRNDRIPIACLNDRGLLIKPGDVNWVGLQTDMVSELKVDISIDSISDESHARTTITASEYDALNYRNSFGEDKKKIADRVNGDRYKIDESSVSIENQIRKDQPYLLKFGTDYKTEKIGDKIYLSPFLDEPLSDNPLKQKERTYPVDMKYPSKRSYSSAFSVPEGYKVEFIPEDVRIRNEMFELNYKVKSDKNNLSVTFDYTFRKSVYPASEYQNLKYYFNEIIKKGNEKVVLVHI